MRYSMHCLMGATDNPSVGKYYIFEYDPKFKDQLKTMGSIPVNSSDGI